MSKPIITNEMVLLAQQGNEDMQNTIIENMMGIIHYWARKYINTIEVQEELISVGMEGVFQAIKKFNPNKDADFTTYATTWLTGRMKRYFQTENRDCRKANFGAISLQSKKFLEGGEHTLLDYIVDDSMIIQAKYDYINSLGEKNIWWAYTQLTEEEKQYFDLHFVQELTQKEMAERLNIKLAQSNYAIRKLRTKLSNLLNYTYVSERKRRAELRKGGKVV